MFDKIRKAGEKIHERERFEDKKIFHLKNERLGYARNRMLEAWKVLVGCTEFVYKKSEWKWKYK